MPSLEAASRAFTIADLRDLAKRRLPRAVFDYVDGGADSEITLAENCSVFDTVRFRPRNAMRTPECDMGIRILGQDLKLPFILAPVGTTRLVYPLGEAHAAAAASAAGAAFTLSSFSGTTIEEVRAAAKGPLWFQLYLAGGRDASLGAIERARNAGFSALVVTADTAVSGMRVRDYRNGNQPLLSGKIMSMLPHLGQFVTRPRWVAGYLADGGLMDFPNLVLADGPMKYREVAAALAQATVTWEDLTWIREAWKGDILVKGLLTAEDANRAVDAGASGVVVSNHGGRQLDTVLPTLRALPEVVQAIGEQATVLMDGGIRRGSDVVKAFALGAKGVMIGRAYMYGLAAGGRRGVDRSIEILRADVLRTLRLLGCPSIREVDAAYLDLPADWPVRGR